MAESKPPNPPPQGGEAAPPEKDSLFRIQMALSDVVLGYWRHFAYAIGVLLLCVLAYGAYDAVMVSRAKEEFRAVADIDWRMPKVDDMAKYGFAPLDDPNDAKRMSDLAEGASRYGTVAADAHGAAAVMAWMRSADAWSRAGNTGEARAALEKASALRVGGLPGFSADAACAAARADVGDTEGAMTLYRDMAGRYEGFLAEESLLKLARAQMDAGKTDDAKRTIDEFRTRFPDSPRGDVLAGMGAASGSGG